MHPNAELITRFYTAFQACDGAAMSACYDSGVRFTDPVFPELHGPQVGAMWRMLTSRASDLQVVFSDVDCGDHSGSAHWEATYTFRATGRTVHNVIDATFYFDDGHIITHEDRFDLWAWTRMALGASGVLLGWSPIVQNRVRSQAAAGLASFMKKEGTG